MNYLRGIYKSYEDIPTGVNKYTFTLNFDIDVITKDAKVCKTAGRWKLLEENLTKGEKTSILEFGGSLGETWIALRDEYDLEYFNVEVKEHVEAANNYFKFEKENFFTDIPNIEELPKIDIVYSREAMQYVSNWQEVINKFVSLKPEKIIFEHICAEDIEDFWSVQHYDNKVCQWHFFNFDKLNTFIESLGYKLTFFRDTPYNWTRLLVDWTDDISYIPTIHKDLVYELQH